MRSRKTYLLQILTLLCLLNVLHQCCQPAQALGMTTTFGSRTFAWEVNIPDPSLMDPSYLGHQYYSPPMVNRYVDYQSSTIAPGQAYTVKLTISPDVFQSLVGQAGLCVHFKDGPGGLGIKQYDCLRVDQVGSNLVYYHSLNEGSFQGPFSIPAQGLDLYYSGVMTLDDHCALGIGFWYPTDYTYDQITVALSESAIHWIGKEPGLEGTPEDNPFTAFDTPAGPGACSLTGQGLPAYTVNTANRGLVIRDVLFRAAGLGPKMTLGLTYNGDPDQSGIFGRSWSFDYEAFVDEQCSLAFLRKGSGQGLFFSGVLCPAESLSYPVALTPVTGNFDAMTRYADRFEYRHKDSRLTYAFTSAVGGRWYLGAVRDRNGNALTIARNADHTIASVTDAAGRAAAFTYDGNKRCTRIDTPDGQYASFSYDASGNLTQVRDVAGNESTYAYNAQNFLVSMTTAGKTTAFAYDPTGKGNIASVTDAAGKVWSYAVSDGAVRATDPTGAVTAYANQMGRTKTVTTPLGHQSAATYDGNLLPTSLMDFRGRITNLAYDFNGNLIRRTDPSGGETLFAYDADSHLKTVTDALGNAWSATYDAKGNRDSLTTPLGRTTTFEYDIKGQLTKATQPGGGSHTFSHDGFGNLTGVTDPLGRVTTYAYDAAGLMRLSKTDPLGRTTSYQYDANRRLTRETPSDGGPRVYGYDCCALASVTDGNGHAATLARDPMLRVSRRTDALGHHIDYAYDDAGFLTRVTDPLGRQANYGLDASKRVVSLANALGRTIGFELDGSGRPVTVTDERGKVTSLEYDDRGLLTSQRDPLGNATATVVRDALGRISSVTNARGGTVSYLRDVDGRITDKKYESTIVASYTYDADGRLASVTDASGTKTFVRDAAGRVTSVTYPDAKTLSLAYDAAGNLTSMTYPDGLVVTYAYNGRNLATSVSFAGQALSLAYDAADNLVGETRPNGVNSIFTHDAANRLTGFSHKKGASVLADLSYVLDAAGQVTTASGTWPLFPRFGSGTATAAYDDAGGLATWRGAAAVCDTDGNLTSMTGTRALTASYDPENRPTSLTLAGKNRSYAYNGLGERVSVTEGATVRTMHHDPADRVIFETNAAGQVTRDTIYVDGRIVASGTVSGGFSFHHQDGLGSTLALTNAAGTAAGRYAYAASGAVVGQSGLATPYTFVGAYGVMDEGDGLYFMHNRYYDAVTGRFLQRDPIGLAGGINPYRYVGNNPVSRIDPFGLMDDVGGGFERWNAAVRSMDSDDRLTMVFLGGTAGWWNIWLGFATGELIFGAAATTTTAAAETGGAAGTAAGVTSCSAEAAGGATAVAEAAAERELFRNTLLPGVDNASPVVNEFLWNTFRNNIPRIARGTLSRGTRW